jgi:hypothetical protein
MGRRAAVLLLLALACSSCGRGKGRLPVYPVRGQVFYEGKPIPGAVIVFHAPTDPERAGLRPTAHAKADGSFVVTTYDSGDGCPAGAYALTVSWNQQVAARVGQEESDAPLLALLPPRFGRPETSGLQATVEKRPNELPPIFLKK